MPQLVSEQRGGPAQKPGRTGRGHPPCPARSIGTVPRQWPRARDLLGPEPGGWLNQMPKSGFNAPRVISVRHM